MFNLLEYKKKEMKCIEYVTCYELFVHYKLMPCSSHGSEPHSSYNFLLLCSLLILIFFSFSLFADGGDLQILLLQITTSAAR